MDSLNRIDSQQAAKELADHCEAVRAIRDEINKVPDLGFASAGTLAKVANAFRVASYHDARRLDSEEKAALLEALGAAHGSLIGRSTDPARASSLTVGFNTLGTLALSWAGDLRWQRGSGPFLIVQKLALAWQLELLAASLLDEIAADQAQREDVKSPLIERLLNAGKLEN